MASSKKNKTAQDQAIAAKRVEFVKANPQLDPAEARKRFFVQTRSAELQAKGVEVTKQKRQELRQKFATGGVQRTGFYTPADLARIAAAKAGGSTGGTSTGGSAGDTSTAGSGQNFAEYKMLSKENTARRPVAPKATSNKGFDEQSFNPMQFFKSPLAKGVVSAAKGAYNVAESSAESFNATFINPAQNLIGAGLNKALGKKVGEKGAYVPQRVAGPMEAAINTADVLISIASAGAAKGAVPALEGLLPVKPGKLQTVKSAVTKFADNTKTTTAGKVSTKFDAKLKAATPVKSSTPKAGVKTAGKADYKPAFLEGVDNAAAKVKPKATPKPKPTAAAKPKSTPKPKASAAPKNAAGKPYTKMKDIDIDLKVGNPSEQAAAKNAKAVIETPAPKAAPKTKAAPKAKTAKEVGKERFEATRAQARKDINASNWKDPNNRFADAWDDTPVDMSKVDFSEFGMESAKPYATGKRAAKKSAAPKVEAPSTKPAAKPKSTPKTTKPKANAKKAFDTKVTAKPASQPTQKLTFNSQAEYDQFLKTGGKERLKQMSTENVRAFYNVNAKWVKGATRRTEVVAQNEAKKVERSLVTQKRYQNARPELKALFNKALVNRQNRQIMAKVTKK